MIPLDKISDFPNHPYKVENNDEMQLMIESIKDGGVRYPVIVRTKEDGRYEMICGHRRKFASQFLGLKEIPAIVRELTKDEATILMVDSNIQREKILPSEKAFAYKMKLEAMNHQGKRTDLTSGQVEQKLEKKTSRDMLAEQSSDSSATIRRYIRLTELIKDMLELVDIGKVAFSPAVELSYLKEDEQYILLDCINKYDSTPSQAQAIHMKKLSQEGKLTAEKIEEMMEEEKPNQKPKYKISYTRFEKYLPRNVITEKEVEDFLFTCVEEHHKREIQKQRAMAR